MPGPQPLPRNQPYKCLNAISAGLNIRDVPFVNDWSIPMLALWRQQKEKKGEITAKEETKKQYKGQV